MPSMMTIKSSSVVCRGGGMGTGPLLRKEQITSRASASWSSTGAADALGTHSHAASRPSRHRALGGGQLMRGLPEQVRDSRIDRLGREAVEIQDPGTGEVGIVSERGTPVGRIVVVR